jgi:TolB-like protein/tetratricopeptide (TPR) repeat protein
LVGLLLLLGGGVTVWQWFVRPSSPDSIRRAPRLSLVVLPFQNLSGDASQEYYADGITEDLTTDLAHIPGAFVIARTSALSYKGRPVDVQKVGETLGVRYVVEGSLRRIEDVLRVNVQLIATENGTHLWSDRFDVAVTSLAQGQEDIVRRIATTLNVQMVDVESARSVRERPTSPDAFDLILQARALHAQPPSRQRESQVLGLYERALLLDPLSLAAMLGIANTIIKRSLGFLGQWVTADELARAATLVAEARAIAPNAEAVLENVALLHQAHEQWDDTAAAAARLVEAYPNNASGYELLGRAKSYTGHADEAIALYDTAIRLNPRNPNLFHFYAFRGFALLQIGRYDEAIPWGERSLAANPEAAAPIRSARYRWIASAHALVGRLEDARRAIAAANKLWPFATARSSAVPENLASPVLVAQIARIREGMRLASLRDHADEDADFHVPSSGALSGTLAGWTPTTVPGAVTIRTAELPALLAQRQPVVIDTVTHATGRSIPGAIGLKHAGSGGTFVDAAQQHLHRKLMELTGGDLTRPIVAVGYNSERFDGYNLALRLVALGYTNVYWYRGGREAWEAAGLPETPLEIQDW